IYGPVSPNDQVLALQDPEVFKRVANKLWRATTRSTQDFDSWLKNLREHQYLSLVGGTKRRGDARESAAIQALRIYCTLLWMAYERMARCYGTLMMLVYLDFCLHSEQEPTPEEKWLFRQWHFPQLYLAGLPLDYLGKPQLRWIIRTLHALWR